MNLKTVAEEWAGAAEKLGSRAGDGGNPKTVEVGLEGTGVTCNPLDPPLKEDRKGAIPLVVEDEGICRREHPKVTGDTGPTPTRSVLERLVDPPPVKCNPNNSPEVDSDDISEMILAEQMVLEFGRNQPKRQLESFRSKLGPVLKRLVDPPLIKCRPNIFLEVGFEREALGLGRNRPKPILVCFQPRPDPKNRPINFLAARPMANLKLITSCFHVRKFENLKFKFELGRDFLPSCRWFWSLSRGSSGGDSKE